MTKLLAIDPGTYQSAYVVYEKKHVHTHGLIPNESLLTMLNFGQIEADELAIEMIRSYGMRVGQEVFDTCVWVGRFSEAWTSTTDKQPRYINRAEVKMHLCHSMQANDTAVNLVLWDRYGGSRAAAVGTKKNPGPLYGFKKDLWAALAVAITATETKPTKAE